MKILIFMPLILLSACNMNNASLKAGMSMSHERWAEPEVNLPNPLGIIRVEYETEKNNIVFCEHISSIQLNEKGDGLNHCGFMFEL